MSDAAQPRLPLAVNVGFAGHRDLESVAGASELLARAVRLLAEAAADLPRQLVGVSDERLGDAYDGPVLMRLLTGEAPGADRLAIAAWRASALGPVRAIYPYRDGDNPLTDRPDRATADDRLPTPPAGGAWTGLDPVGLGDPHDGHAEVGRWLARWSDLLVALWDGTPAKGPGGTGETVDQARRCGVPVLWLDPASARIRLLAGGNQAQPPTGETEPLSDDGLKAETLKALVTALGPPVGEGLGDRDPEVASRRDYARVDPVARSRPVLGRLRSLSDRTIWKSYSLFKRFAGGQRPEPGAAVSPPPALRASAGFAFVERARQEAAARSAILSGIHRSEQLLLILLAVAAVFVGASPALGVGHEAAASIELAIGGVAFVVALLARRAHRHRRWGDARRLAERLRAASASWPLGVDLGQLGDVASGAWTEWRARAVLRAAGPPSGWLDRAAVDAVMAWNRADLVNGQQRYHRDEERAAAAIDRVLRRVEAYAFLTLVATLAGYLAASWVLGVHDLYAWTPGLVTLVSAGAPAVGAAALALEAANGFGELALRGKRAAEDFGRLAHDWKPSPSLPDAQDLVLRAAQLVVEDADAWRDRVARTPIKQT